MNFAIKVKALVSMLEQRSARVQLKVQHWHQQHQLVQIFTWEKKQLQQLRQHMEQNTTIIKLNQNNMTI
jgi:methyl coenzyme M reductase subunit C-like uncharacterized protein (methanogenesis marker protein 7)